MRILEIKNSLLKISYEVEDNLALSGFTVIEDKNTPYVAQVVNLKAENGRNYAVLKLLFTFNDEGVLKPYDGTIPSLEANVTSLPAYELLDVLPSDNPVYLGAVNQQDVAFKLDSSAFQSNLLICSDNVDNTSKILSNILPQMVDQGKKVVLFDVNGDFASDENFIFGRNFKLPLNAQFLDYIFDNDLEGVEPVSKAVIQDIFREVQGYMDTLPQGYLPIDLFINVVQQQYLETGIAELVLLKNKLLKYQENNVFASGNDDVTIFRNKVAHSDSLIVDISDVDVKLQKLLIPYMFDAISTVNSDTFVMITVNNDVADKKLLRKTLEFKNIYTTIVCSHEFKYLPDLKQIIQNLILFAPQTLQHDFANYNTFLNKLNSDEFVVFGPATQQIPFIAQVKPYEELIELDNQRETADTEDTIETPVVEDDTPNPFAVADTSVLTFNDNVSAEQSQIIDEEMVSDGVADVVEEDNSVNDFIEELPIEQETTDSGEILSEEKEEDFVDLPQFETVDEKPNVEKFPSEESNELYNVDDEPSFEEEVQQDRDVLEEQIAQDVDASFYNKFEEETLESENEVSPEVLLDDEPQTTAELSDNDLDYLQSMPIDNSEEEAFSPEDFAQNLEPAQTVEDLEGEILDEGALEELSVDNQEVFENYDENVSEESQMVPVYTPEEFSETPTDDAPAFESGDVVTHPKYGQGVVEKMINYGNKTLCSISFVNIGRRLLDPNLSELTLVSRDGMMMS